MQDLRKRTKDFALQVVRAHTSLPRKIDALELGRQFLRSGTSVGAHYREACRAKSDADFISKIEGALQELDETSYWIEMLRDLGHIPDEKATGLGDECDELMAIFVTMTRNVKCRDGKG